jgi:hypothetical protein
MSDNEETLVEKLIYLCQSADLNYRAYSGRGMYGKYCLGIIHSHPEEVITTLFSVALEFDWTREELVDLCNMLESSRTDSMGLSTILYWPKLELTADQCEDMAYTGDDE